MTIAANHPRDPLASRLEPNTNVRARSDPSLRGKTLRVALITDPIDDNSTGLSSYVGNLVPALEQLSDEVNLTLVHASQADFYRGRRELIVPAVKKKGALKGTLNWTLRKQLLMPRALRPLNFDLVHDTYHFGPFLTNAPYRKVATIHDLIPLILPRTTDWLFLTLHKVLARAVASRADQIIVDSSSTKRDVERLIGIPAERIHVVHLAADPSLRRVCDQDKLTEVRIMYGLPERFFLYLGSIAPHKNLVRLIEAFKSALPLLPDTSLVLAGGLAWKYQEIVRAAREPAVAGRVIMPGRVRSEDLRALYSLATAFVFPSLYEGFGLPPLEAMQCGTPAIISNTSSLPEVGGNAAKLVDPYSIEDIAGAMVALAQNQQLRDHMSELGLLQAKKFSWRNCAKETIDVYKLACASPQGS